MEHYYLNNSNISINIGRLVLSPGEVLTNPTEQELNNIRAEIGNKLVEIDEKEALQYTYTRRDKRRNQRFEWDQDRIVAWKIKNKKDFDVVYEKLTNRENFSLVRFGEGEAKIIRNCLLDQCIDKRKFDFIPTEKKYREARKELIQSGQFKSDDYIVAINYLSDSHAHNDFHVNLVLKKLRIDRKDTLDAWLFSHDNYVNLTEPKLVPLLKDRENILVCSKNGKITFPHIEHISCLPENAWIGNKRTLNQVLKSARKHNNKIFLFAAGPYSNTLVHQARLANSNNTYINIGSALDPFIYNRPTRSYHSYAKGDWED
jgi:hypothetical protein